MKYQIVNNPANLGINCHQNLTKKINLHAKPNCDYLFVYGKLGESVWKKTLEKFKFRDFVFFDPYNRESLIDYNPLLDPHLQEYFHRKNIRNHLLKSHIITDQDEIICSVQDFNKFRRCMHRLKVEGDFERQKRCNTEKSNKIAHPLNYGPNQKSKNPMSYENVLNEMKMRKIMMEEVRNTKNFAKVQKYHQQVKKIDKLQEQKRIEMIERGEYRNRERTKKRIFVLEKSRDRRAQIKEKIYQRERRLMGDDPVKMEPISYIIRCPVKI